MDGEKTVKEAQSFIDWLNVITSLTRAELLKRLREEYLALPPRPPITLTTQFWANIPNNKNRYMDIPCLDQTRVRLRCYGNDYIHANWVEFPDFPSKMIISQAPKENTVNDFWNIIIDENVKLIISLTNIREKGKEKCYPYWPRQIGDKAALKFRDITVRNKKSYKQSSSVISTLYVEKSKKRCKIKHISHLEWPDHNVPTCTHSFMEFLDLCDQLASPDTKRKTILIHCSAGVGRSGTLLALLVMGYQIGKGLTPDIYKVVKSLREQRALAVQGMEQYTFIYRTVLEMVWKKTQNLPHTLNERVINQIKVLRSVTTKSTCSLVPAAHVETEVTVREEELSCRTVVVGETTGQPVLQQTITGVEEPKKSGRSKEKGKAISQDSKALGEVSSIEPSKPRSEIVKPRARGMKRVKQVPTVTVNTETTTNLEITDAATTYAHIITEPISAPSPPRTEPLDEHSRFAKTFADKTTEMATAFKRNGTSKKDTAVQEPKEKEAKKGGKSPDQKTKTSKSTDKKDKKKKKQNWGLFWF